MRSCHYNASQQKSAWVRLWPAIFERSFNPRLIIAHVVAVHVDIANIESGRAIWAFNWSAICACAPYDKQVLAVANSGYIANGGDELEYLKNIPQENRGYLFRDAIIDYIRDQIKQGKKISATLQNRISYAQYNKIC